MSSGPKNNSPSGPTYGSGMPTQRRFTNHEGANDDLPPQPQPQLSAVPTCEHCKRPPPEGERLQYCRRCDQHFCLPCMPLFFHNIHRDEEPEKKEVGDTPAAAASSTAPVTEASCETSPPRRRLPESAPPKRIPKRKVVEDDDDDDDEIDPADNRTKQAHQTKSLADRKTAAARPTATGESGSTGASKREGARRPAAADESQRSERAVPPPGPPPMEFSAVDMFEELIAERIIKLSREREIERALAMPREQAEQDFIEGGDRAWLKHPALVEMCRGGAREEALDIFHQARKTVFRELGFSKKMKPS